MKNIAAYTSKGSMPSYVSINRREDGVSIDVRSKEENGSTQASIKMSEEVWAALSAQIAQDSLESGAHGLNALSRIIHGRNVEAGWWTDLSTGESLEGYKGDEPRFSEAKRDLLNLLCLVHSEISEACEGVRKNCRDDKLPHRSMLEVELADAMIRMFDIAGAHNLDLSGALLEKLAFNANRSDHKIENRLSDEGKKY